MLIIPVLSRSPRFSLDVAAYMNWICKYDIHLDSLDRFFFKFSDRVITWEHCTLRTYYGIWLKLQYQ